MDSYLRQEIKGYTVLVHNHLLLNAGLRYLIGWMIAVILLACFYYYSHPDTALSWLFIIVFLAIVLPAALISYNYYVGSKEKVYVQDDGIKTESQGFIAYFEMLKIKRPPHRNGNYNCYVELMNGRTISFSKFNRHSKTATEEYEAFVQSLLSKCDPEIEII